MLRRGERSAVYALRDGTMEQTLFPRSNKVDFDRGCTSTLAVDRNLARVASKSRDVRLDPSHCLRLILYPDVEIAQRGVAGEGRVGEEAEGVQPVINRDDHDVGDLMDPVVVWQAGGVAVIIACKVQLLRSISKIQQLC